MVHAVRKRDKAETGSDKTTVLVTIVEPQQHPNNTACHNGMPHNHTEHNAP